MGDDYLLKIISQHILNKRTFLHSGTIWQLKCTLIEKVVLFTTVKKKDLIKRSCFTRKSLHFYAIYTNY